MMLSWKIPKSRRSTVQLWFRSASGRPSASTGIPTGVSSQRSEIGDCTSGPRAFALADEPPVATRRVRRTHPRIVKVIFIGVVESEPTAGTRLPGLHRRPGTNPETL